MNVQIFSVHFSLYVDLSWILSYDLAKFLDLFKLLLLLCVLGLAVQRHHLFVDSFKILVYRELKFLI